METWSVKITDELKGKIQELAKQDFENNQDFMNTLINTYELQKMKQDGSVLSGEVDEIQKLTNRIVNLFVHANDKTATLLEDTDKAFQNEVASKEDTIKMLHEKLKEMELARNNIGNINDTLAASNKEYSNEIIELNKSKATLESLVSEYKEKNDTLTGLLSEYKQDREDNKKLQEQAKEFQVKLNELNAAATEQAKQIIDADNKLQEQANKHQDAIQEILRKHVDELEATRGKAEIDANMTILKLQQEHQAKAEALQEKLQLSHEKHSSEVESINTKHSETIESYQSKYRSLLEELEANQKSCRALEKNYNDLKLECTNLQNKIDQVKSKNNK